MVDNFVFNFHQRYIVVIFYPGIEWISFKLESNFSNIALKWVVCGLF